MSASSARDGLYFLYSMDSNIREPEDAWNAFSGREQPPLELMGCHFWNIPLIHPCEELRS